MNGIEVFAWIAVTAILCGIASVIGGISQLSSVSFGSNIVLVLVIILGEIACLVMYANRKKILSRISWMSFPRCVSVIISAALILIWNNHLYERDKLETIWKILINVDKVVLIWWLVILCLPLIIAAIHRFVIDHRAEREKVIKLESERESKRLEIEEARKNQLRILQDIKKTDENEGTSIIELNNSIRQIGNEIEKQISTYREIDKDNLESNKRKREQKESKQHNKMLIAMLAFAFAVGVIAILLFCLYAVPKLVDVGINVSQSLNASASKVAKEFKGQEYLFLAPVIAIIVLVLILVGIYISKSEDIDEKRLDVSVGEDGKFGLSEFIASILTILVISIAIGYGVEKENPLFENFLTNLTIIKLVTYILALAICTIVLFAVIRYILDECMNRTSFLQKGAEKLFLLLLVGLLQIIISVLKLLYFIPDFFSTIYELICPGQTPSWFGNIQKVINREFKMELMRLHYKQVQRLIADKTQFEKEIIAMEKEVTQWVKRIDKEKT